MNYCSETAKPGESDQNMNQSNRNDQCPCCIPWRSAVPRRPNTNTSSTSQSAPSIDFGNFYVLRNANVWTLEDNSNSSSVLDIWVSNGKIVSMVPPSAARSMCPSIPGLKEIDMRGLDIVPGFVDIHVHAIGGGGEDSFGSRTPEACLEELVEAGVTTFVGILGTDTVGRNMESLIAKTRALSEKGLTGRVWLGGYAFPIENTVTGSVRKDLTMLPDVIGVGELAISDHRSSFPTTDDLLKLCSEVRVAGMVSGNAGVTYFHMGDNETALQPLVDVVKRNPVLWTYLVPTHMERTPTLIQQGKAWMEAGGFVDFSCWPERQRVAIRQYLEDGEDGETLIHEKLSISSDSYGSISVFDDNGTIVDSTYGKPKTLLETFMALVYKDGVSIDTALRLFCRNPAKVIRMDKMPMNKGKISVGSDADFLVLKLPENPLPLNYPCKVAHGMSWPSADGILQYVIASGKVMKCPRNTSAREQVMASQSQISQSMRSTTQTRVGENGRSTLHPFREQAKKQASSTSRRPIVVAQVAYRKDSSNGHQIVQASKEVVNREQVHGQKQASGTLQRPAVAQRQQQTNSTSERPEVIAQIADGKDASNNGSQVAHTSKAVANRETVQMQNQANSDSLRTVVAEQIVNRNDASNDPKNLQTTIPIQQEQAHVQNKNRLGLEFVRLSNVSVAQEKTTTNLEIPPGLPGLGPISPEITNPPKKRGRGRPRKDASITSTSKSDSALNERGGQQPQPVKKRGRPRKDSSLPPQSTKKRGRPRKDASVDAGSKDVAASNEESGQQQQTTEKRGRGRPRKDASVDTGSKDAAPANTIEGQQQQTTEKRGRGRPRKDASVDAGSKDVVASNGESGQQQQPAKKRGRGRPRKDASVDAGSKDVAPTNTIEGQQQQTTEKRGRGSPRKDASVDAGSKDVVASNGESGQQQQPAKKRGTGSPRKDASVDAGSKNVVPTNGESGQQQQTTEKRGRGRPRKDASVDAGSKDVAPQSGNKRGRGRPRKNVSPNENSLPMLSNNGEAEQHQQSEKDTSITGVADSSTPSTGDEPQPPQPTTESQVTTERKSSTNSKGDGENSPQPEKKHGRVRSGRKSPLIYLF